MKTDKKVIFLDMDDTTLDSNHELSEENREAMRKAIEAGHDVVVTTGRTTASANYLMEHYKLAEIGCRYMITYNGAAIFDYQTKEVLYSKTIPLEHVWYLIDRAREQGVYIHGFKDGKVVTERDDENWAHYRKKTSMECMLVPDIKEVITEAPNKMLAIHVSDQQVLKDYADSWKEWAEDKLAYSFSCREYLEIVPKGVSKGTAITEFCRLMDIPFENTLAAGDQNNDLPMLRLAGIGCAVANALPEVKAEADYITERDNDHSAVAEIIEKFML